MNSEHNERIYGDTTECSKCGKQWDTNDPEPPPCLTDQDRINQLRDKFKLKRGNDNV